MLFFIKYRFIIHFLFLNAVVDAENLHYICIVKQRW